MCQILERLLVKEAQMANKHNKDNLTTIAIKKKKPHHSAIPLCIYPRNVLAHMKRKFELSQQYCLWQTDKKPNKQLKCPSTLERMLHFYSRILQDSEKQSPVSTLIYFIQHRREEVMEEYILYNSIYAVFKNKHTQQCTAQVSGWYTKACWPNPACDLCWYDLRAKNGKFLKDLKTNKNMQQHVVHKA